MLKRKNAKSTAPKKTATRKTKTKALSPLENAIKEFPSKLTSFGKKEMAVLKLKEKKLKADLKKAFSQKKVAQTKHASLLSKLKGKVNATSKKQSQAAKAALDKVATFTTSLTSKLDEMKKQISELSGQQSRYSALSKHLKEFEKSWKSQSTVSPSPVAAAKTKKAKKKKLTANKPKDMVQNKQSNENEAVASEAVSHPELEVAE